MLSFISKGGSSTDSAEDEDEEAATSPSMNIKYTSLADDHAASLLLNSQQGDVSSVVDYC